MHLLIYHSVNFQKRLGEYIFNPAKEKEKLFEEKKKQARSRFARIWMHIASFVSYHFFIMHVPNSEDGMSAITLFLDS